MSNTNSIRSIPSVEVASSSDTNAPVFYFNQYNQSQEYFNNRERIDFVTYEGSLYVPGAERVVPETNDITRENFVLLVSRGPQGLPGTKGDPGRDGRTPSVFARFDGKQMIFYTNELNEDGTQKINERTGEPVIKRIAATNDLTGPSWRPKRVDDTIIWEKTRDDSQPESINLSDFVKETAPVIFRVDSDNTKRTDETSGPANYIQWKYEGDEYWNNLISISELMNLALAGVCIWFDEEDQEYHLGHRQVITATYDSSETGKRIISDVEHGEVLYDAGPIHLPDFTADIAALWEEVCALKDRVNDIEEELPKFVKSVNRILPDENGNVEISVPNMEEYIKASDLRFKVEETEGGRYLYYSTNAGEEGSWIQVMEATCACKATTYYTVTFGTPNPSNAVMTVDGAVKNPGDTVRVAEGATICVDATADGYKDFYRCYSIKEDTTISPELTPEEAPATTYTACIVDDTNLADKIYIGTLVANKQQSCLSNLSDGTLVKGKATRDNYKNKYVSGSINGDDLELHITGDWEEEEVEETYTFRIAYSPNNATIKINGVVNDNHYIDGLSEGDVVTWEVSADQYETQSGSWEMEARDKLLTVNLIKLIIDPTTLDFEAAGESKDVTVTTNVDNYTVTPECEGWLSYNKNGSTLTITAAENTGDERTCDVIVEAGNVEKTIHVTQAAGEVTPTTYKVTAKAASCDPSITIVGLSTNENGPFESSSLTVNVGQTLEEVFVKATRTGYKDWIIPYNNVSETNNELMVPCDGWEEIEPEKHELTITSTNTPIGYSIKVREDLGTWNTITLTDDAYSGYYEDGTHIEILPEKDGYHTSITTTTSGISDPAEFDMTKDTSINIEWVEDTPEYIKVERIDITGEPSGNITLDCENPQTYQLTATVDPTTASNKTINWHSSDESIATVSNTGEVTILSDGEVQIYANGADNVNGHVTLTIVRPAVTSITLNQTSLTLGQDHEEDDVVITGYTPSCATITGAYEYYSSDPNVAEVTKYGGHVTAKNNGTCKITAYCYTTGDNSPVTKKCTVEVQDLGPVYVYRTNVTGPASINSGECNDSIGASLERKRTDSDTWETVIQDLTNKDGFSWRVENTTQAHVEGQHTLCVDSGVLQDLHIQLYGDYSTTEYPDVTSGHCDIDGIAEPTTYTASVNAESGCAPTSYTLTSNGVSVNNDSLSNLANGSTVTLVAKRTDYNDIQLSGTINDQNYVFNINCSDWVSTVVPVTSVVMNCHEGSIMVGDQITLSATVYPENATDKTITWVQGSSPKGTIEGNTFTATSDGIALIHAEAGGVSSNECGITIDPRPVSVEGISIDSCPGTIAQGLTNVYLTATIDPSDATNKNVTWSSSDSNIIEVEETSDGRGHLIVKNTAGKATITVTTEDGSYTSSCTIIVPSTAIEFAISNQTESGNTIRYTIGDNIDENDWYETWDSLDYGQTTGTNPPLTISPGESLCITSENYPEDIQLEVNGTNRDDTNGFITMTYDELYAAAGYSNTYIVTFVREH